MLQYFQMAAMICPLVTLPRRPSHKRAPRAVALGLSCERFRSSIQMGSAVYSAYPISVIAP